MENIVIGVAHNQPDPLSRDSRDVLDQVAAVEDVLAEQNIQSVRLPFTRDAGMFLRRMTDSGADLLINLCENVDDDARLTGHPAAVFELLGVPFSGSPASALMLSTDKYMSKKILQASGIDTPGCVIYEGRGNELKSPLPLKYPVIVKPQFEDASIGIDQESIFTDESQLRENIDGFFHKYGPMVIEELVQGREFNISVFGYPFPRVLPIAEIRFSNFPEHLYPIVGYRAKWDESSFEYHHTPRVFPDDIGRMLRRRLEVTALTCFRVFGLRDYGRVDLRLDEAGNIRVLEINANPCISPDAGFTAAVAQSGMTFTHFISSLVNFAKQRSGNHHHQASYRTR